HLTDDSYEQALDRILAASEKNPMRSFNDGQALSILAHCWEGENLARTVDIAIASKSEVVRASVFISLIPYIVDEMAAQILNSALSIKSDNHRIEVLGALMPKLPVEMRTQVLRDTVDDVLKKQLPISMLGDIIQYAPDDVIRQLAATALVIEDKPARV